MVSMWKVGAGLLLAGGVALGLFVHSRHGGEASVADAFAFSSTAQAAVPPTVIGMNMGDNQYWQSTWIFADIVPATLNLRFQRDRWEDITNQIKLDSTGHPVDVPMDTQLIAIIQQGAPKVSAGNFRCHLSKGWSVRPFGGWEMDGGSTDFRMKVPNTDKIAITLILKATSDHANLTQLSCRPEKSDPAQLFNPQFLADIKPYRVIRFMDWMRTNGAPKREWEKRPTPAFISQAGDQGVALEHMVALANTSAADPWFNLPMDADPAYYREFATYVRDHLAPDRKAYVELSNEVWNTSFQQGKDAVIRGKLLYPSANAGQANDYYYADRVRDLMAIWSDVFRGQEQRLVRVLATQAVNSMRAEQALSHKDTWRSVDALATAPYFSTLGLDLNVVTGSRVEAVFAEGPQLVDAAINHALENKRVATKYKLRYIGYEGGPDFQNYRPEWRDDFAAINADPRMVKLYDQYLHRWQAEVGDLIVLYQSHSSSVYGHRLYTGQPLSEAPRAKLLMDYIPQ